MHSFIIFICPVINNLNASIHAVGQDSETGREMAATLCRWGISYSNTTVYYGMHECSECIPVDSGVNNLIHDRRCCVHFTLEVEANLARCVHSSVNKPGVKRNSGL